MQDVNKFEVNYLGAGQTRGNEKKSPINMPSEFFENFK